MFGADQPRSESQSLALGVERSWLGPTALEWLRGYIKAHPQSTLASVARASCLEFGWRRPNGLLPQASFEALLRRLERRGEIRLLRAPRAVRVGGRRARHIDSDHAEILEFLGPVPGMVECQPSGPLTVRPIAPEEWQGFRLHLRKYHYLGFNKPIGESLYYAAFLGADLVALLVWGAAALHNVPRDRYIGWDTTSRARRLLWVTNNRRFLILPWIRVPHLASRVLAANLRRLSRDWESAYRHEILLAETFVDTARFRGTCYRASNWVYLGETRGFSRSQAGFSPNQRPKAVFVFALRREACRLLRGSP